MRTIHYDRLEPLVTAFEIVDDFGNLIEFENVAAMRKMADQWTYLLFWARAAEFCDSGLEVI